jgi:hypothetical protein
VEPTPPSGESFTILRLAATWKFYAASLSCPEPPSSNSIEMTEGGRVACYETPAVFLLARSRNTSFVFTPGHRRCLRCEMAEMAQPFRKIDGGLPSLALSERSFAPFGDPSAVDSYFRIHRYGLLCDLSYSIYTLR